MVTDTELAQGYVAGFFRFLSICSFKKIEPATTRWARNERWARNGTLSA